MAACSGGRHDQPVGAIHAYPEAIESSLRLGAIALRMLQVPTADIDQMLQDIRDWDYQAVIEQPRPAAANAEGGAP